jgi:hypothetical protein
VKKNLATTKKQAIKRQTLKLSKPTKNNFFDSQKKPAPCEWAFFMQAILISPVTNN